MYSDLYCTKSDNFSPTCKNISLGAEPQPSRGSAPDPAEGAYKTASPRSIIAVIGEKDGRGEKERGTVEHGYEQGSICREGGIEPTPSGFC